MVLPKRRNLNYRSPESNLNKLNPFRRISRAPIKQSLHTFQLAYIIALLVILCTLPAGQVLESASKGESRRNFEFDEIPWIQRTCRSKTVFK